MTGKHASLWFKFTQLVKTFSQDIKSSTVVILGQNILVGTDIFNDFTIFVNACEEIITKERKIVCM